MDVIIVCNVFLEVSVQPIILYLTFSDFLPSITSIYNMSNRISLHSIKRAIARDKMRQPIIEWPTFTLNSLRRTTYEFFGPFAYSLLLSHSTCLEFIPFFLSYIINSLFLFVCVFSSIYRIMYRWNPCNRLQCCVRNSSYTIHNPISFAFFGSCSRISIFLCLCLVWEFQYWTTASTVLLHSVQLYHKALWYIPKRTSFIKPLYLGSTQ